MKKSDIILKRMRKKNLSKYACSDFDSITLFDEKDDIRPRFLRDSDRILYSLSFTRYIDKTQVFTFTNNDNISKRITHVQYVSKIARTIGRALGLNEDLIEAASLGHDLGHPPFGHCGEKILNKICIENNEGCFAHNVQSVRILKELEDNGVGKNLSIQVLDAILCHNGEILSSKYYPMTKDKNMFLDEYNACLKDINVSKKLIPMTLEGCVVRISDIIAYAFKDVEDAIRLGVITPSSIPKDITDVLGNTNGKSINSIVLDIINNSINKPYIKMSKSIYNALNSLIKFNYDNIYNVINDTSLLNYYEKMFYKLFNNYKKVLENKDCNNDIYTVFLNKMSDSYINTSSDIRKIIDYISGMTDDYFIDRYNEISSIKIKR